MPILYADYSTINHEEMAHSIGLKPIHVPLILSSFLDETKMLLGKLKESVSINDCINIKLNAHAIKGSASNLKFDEISQMAREMEQAGANKRCDFEYNAYIDAITKSLDTILI